MTATSKFVHVHDLGQNPLGVVTIGEARISTNHLRILHKIDLNAILDAIEEVQQTVRERAFNDEVLGPLIKLKVRKLIDTHKKLKPVKSVRKKRWEALGSAWKYISGSPDAEDLRIINVTTNSLIEQNNEQVRINKQFENRIYNISKSLSVYISSFSNEIINRMNSVNLLFNIDELINHLESIEEAITLARANLPSSRLITTQELQLARNFITDNHLGLDSPNDILDIASAYILHNAQQIIYVLKIPKIKAVAYKLYYIEPVINNGSKIYIQSNYLLKGIKSYAVQSLCPRLKNLYICPSTQLKPADSCITKIINGNFAHCPVEKTYGQNHIKRIDEANIIVNDGNITLSSNCLDEPKKLVGSFLLQISNCSIYMDGEEYMNVDVSIPVGSFIPTTGLKVNATKVINRIPLEFLQTFHLEHRETLRKLNLTTDNIQGRLNIFKWLSLGSISTTTTLIIIIIAVWILRTISSRIGVTVEEKATPETERERSSSASTRHPRLIPQQ